MGARGRCAAVTAAVLAWALGRGFAAAQPADVLRSEWMAPVTAAAAREVATRVLAARGLTADLRDSAVGSEATRWRRYEPSAWLPVERLDLPAGYRAERIQVHTHVAPELEPARIALGVVLEIRGPAGRARIPRHPGLEAHVAGLLAAALGVELEPLAATADRRVEQARRLLPAGAAGGCGVRTPEAAGTLDRDVHRAPRRMAYPWEPVYPDGARTSDIGGAVAVEATLTEHGTLAGIVVGDSGTNALDFAAAGAISLWRFLPAIVDGCPAPVVFRGGATFRPR